MVKHAPPQTRWMSRLWRGIRFRLKGPWITDVPNALAQCEFNCSETDCRLNRWLTCENRLRTSQSLDEWDHLHPVVELSQVERSPNEHATEDTKTTQS